MKIKWGVEGVHQGKLRESTLIAVNCVKEYGVITAAR